MNPKMKRIRTVSKLEKSMKLMIQKKTNLWQLLNSHLLRVDFCICKKFTKVLPFYPGITLQRAALDCRMLKNKVIFTVSKLGFAVPIAIFNISLILQQSISSVTGLGTYISEDCVIQFLFNLLILLK